MAETQTNINIYNSKVGTIHTLHCAASALPVHLSCLIPSDPALLSLSLAEGLVGYTSLNQQCTLFEGTRVRDSVGVWYVFWSRGHFPPTECLIVLSPSKRTTCPVLLTLITPLYRAHTLWNRRWKSIFVHTLTPPIQHPGPVEAVTNSELFGSSRQVAQSQLQHLISTCTRTPPKCTQNQHNQWLASDHARTQPN